MQIVLSGSADKRMAFRYANCVLNDRHRGSRGLRINREQELEYAFEIIQGLPCIDYFRHVRDFGRAGVFPFARALM